MPKKKTKSKDTKYQRQSLYLLTNEYPRLSIRAIELTFKKEYNFQFTPAFNRLRDIQDVILQADDNEDGGGGGVHEVEEEDALVRARILREAPFLENVAKILNKTTRPEPKTTLRKQNLDHGLLKEMSLIPKLNRLISTEGQPKEPEETLAVGEDGEPLACDCCMEDLLVTTEMVHCNASSPDGRHYFCKTCIQRHLSEQLYGKNDDGPLKCMTYTEECPNFFAEDKVASVLTPRTKANYEARLAQKAVKAVPGIDLRQCPQCGAQFDIVEGLRDLDCPECKFKSCLKCQNASHPNQTCEEAGQERAQLNPRSHTEHAMTTAVVRQCPSCKVPFQKGGKRECNKIICTCGTMSCYLCRQEIKLKQPYKHFCQTPHCTHDSCGKCVLFTDTEEDDRIARRQAKRQAKRFAKEQKARTAGHGISSPVCEARKHTKQGAPEPKRAAAAAAAVPRVAAPPVAATAPPVAAAGAPPPPRARQEQHATPPRRQRQEQPVPPLPRRRQEPQRDRDEALEQPQVEQRRRQEEAKAQQQQLRQEAAEQQRRRDADNLRRQQQEAEQQRLRQEAEEQRRLAADNLQQQPQEQAKQQRQRQEDEAENIHQQQCPCACIVL